MSVTSSKLLDGIIAGLVTAVLLAMKDLVIYQQVNWTITLAIAATAFLLWSLALPLLRKQLSKSSKRVAG
ncbi:hypothetical protein [Alkalicoccobacillus porphyridii]|uniref:Uncharacterized protein n=1 Tax=Alkalicoccobacillus porphyridii TaxID=2597270 RepID=A0A554A3B5_9BACI|nr:hypothetical protein [Alkalicoccobacillus porphyridii]TSB48180.1 hypothetical protein FN960_01090 [Alkalicoccobacillus porphyridii]